jgi:thiamine biosynthesis protein ThiS
MKLKINGKEESVAEGMGLNELIQSLQLNPEAVAVELNLDIVTRDKRASVRLKEGDEVEIVKFVGGGRG